MLESTILILLMVLGTLSLVVAIFYFLFNFFSFGIKSIKPSLYFFSIPTFCFGIIFIWYGIVVPWSNKTIMEDYSGTYVSEKGKFKITLKPDGTYFSDSIPKVRIHKKGIWKTDGIDGLFDLYDNKGNVINSLSNSTYSSGIKAITFIWEDITFLSEN